MGWIPFMRNELELTVEQSQAGRLWPLFLAEEHGFTRGCWGGKLKSSRWAGTRDGCPSRASRQDGGG
jgi:hypothetical protein